MRIDNITLDSLIMKRFYAKMLTTFEPLAPMSVAEFCDKHRILSKNTADRFGPWDTRVVEYFREPMEQINNPNCREIVVVAGTQVGKTECMIMNLILYTSVRKPGSTIVVYPKKSAAQGEFYDGRLRPMVRDCPILHNIFRFGRTATTSFNKNNIVYPGGFIRMSGPERGDLASTPSKYVFIDEVCRVPVSNEEGETVSLLRKRQATFVDAKMIGVSSPAREGRCPITSWYYASRYHKYEAKCPHCQKFVFFDWEMMEWDEGDYGTAHIVCPECTRHIKEEHKYQAVLAGRWKCLNPDHDEREMAYQISALYSSFIPWKELVKEYCIARKEQSIYKNDGKMLEFVTTRLARAYEPICDGLDPSSLYARRESYNARVPAGALFLTAGIDVNGSDITVLTVGWGERHEAYVVDYRVMFGDPAGDDVWRELATYLTTEFRHENGYLIPVYAAALDQGYRTQMAEKFITGIGSKLRIIAVKGVGGEHKNLLDKFSFSRKDGGFKRIPLWMISDWKMKEKVYSDLKMAQGENFIHFPLIENEELNPFSLKFFRELTCEKIVVRNDKAGYPKKIGFEKPSHMRNEPLDTMKMALAARMIILSSAHPEDPYRTFRESDKWKTETYMQLKAEGLLGDEADRFFNIKLGQKKAVSSHRVKRSPKNWVYDW